MNEKVTEAYSRPALIEVGNFAEATQGTIVPASFDGVTLVFRF